MVLSRQKCETLSTCPIIFNTYIKSNAKNYLYFT